MAELHVKKNKTSFLEKLAIIAPNWLGTTESLLLHTVFFIGIFVLTIFGIEPDQVMLILTTVVSLEAIYLSLFIQITVNRNTKSLKDVEQDIDEIQEDVEGIEGDFVEIQEEVEDISDDLERMQVEDKISDVNFVESTEDPMNVIENHLSRITDDMALLKKEILELKRNSIRP